MKRALFMIAGGLGLALATGVFIGVSAVRGASKPVSKTTITAAEPAPVWTDVEIGDFTVSLPGTPLVQERDELADAGQALVVTKTVIRHDAELMAMSLTLEGSDCNDLLERSTTDTIDTLMARMQARGAKATPVENRALTLHGLPARRIEIASQEANGSTRRIRYQVFSEDCRLLLVFTSTTPESEHLSENVFKSIRRRP